MAGVNLIDSSVPGVSAPKKHRGRKKGDLVGRSTRARALTPVEVGQLLVGMRDLPESAESQVFRNRNFCEVLILATSPCLPSGSALLRLGQIYDVKTQTVLTDVVLRPDQQGGSGLNKTQHNKQRKSHEAKAKEAKGEMKTEIKAPKTKSKKLTDLHWYMGDAVKSLIEDYVRGHFTEELKHTEHPDGLYLFPSDEDGRFPHNPMLLRPLIKRVAERVFGAEKAKNVTTFSLRHSVLEALTEYFKVSGAHTPEFRAKCCVYQTKQTATSCNRATREEIINAWTQARFFELPTGAERPVGESPAKRQRVEQSDLKSESKKKSQWKSESASRDIIEKLLHPHKFPEGLGVGRPRFDGGNWTLGLAFEYQGRQHYEFTPFFHKTREDFEKQLQRDAKKRKYAEEHQLKLLEIPHTEGDHRNLKKLEEFILSWLLENGFGNHVRLT